MAMSSAPARPEADLIRRTVQIRGHVPPPPQPSQAMSLRDVSVPAKRVAPRLAPPAPVPNVRSAPLPGSVAARRRPPRPVAERIIDGSPDRLAMWAFVMAVFLVLVATLSAS
jgi:hypothetical protein